jgi:hypothetical protein
MPEQYLKGGCLWYDCRILLLLESYLASLNLKRCWHIERSEQTWHTQEVRPSLYHPPSPQVLSFDYAGFLRRKTTL